MKSAFSQLTARSDREFGFVFGAFCALVAAYLWWNERSAFLFWCAAALVFAGLGVALPVALRPMNFAWLKFGAVLHAITSPIILGLMFFAVFAPLGLLMRILGKRPLQLRLDRAASSYWIHRHSPGPDAKSFDNQF